MSDLDRLMEAMAASINGKGETVDEGTFDDPNVARTYNDMIKSFDNKNNQFLMRFNDAMELIADGSYIKGIFEQIESQQEPIANLKMMRESYATSNDKILECSAVALAHTKMVLNSITPSVDDMINMCEKLPEYLSDEEGIIKLGGIIQNNAVFFQSLIKGLDETVKACEELADIVEGMDELKTPFLESVEALSSSYDSLSMKCFNVGQHLYRISRTVDNTRNDMYRQHSKPTLHDALKVFQMDHLTITWRLYNHIVEFETLRIGQVNNPDGCKFGLWCKEVAPEWLRETEAFKRADKAHRDIHEHAVNCFNAKAEYNTPCAVDEFEKALVSLEEFFKGLEDIHNELRMHQIIDETDYYKFEG